MNRVSSQPDGQERVSSQPDGQASSKPGGREHPRGPQVSSEHPRGPGGLSDPYFIEGPALISFSGGRTSGYMLRQILDRGLQPDVHVAFCNTGKEDNRTLDFVHAVENCWQVPIVWLQYRRRYLPQYKSQEVADVAAALREHFGIRLQPAPEGETEPGFEVVDYASAARTTDVASERHPFTNLVCCSGVPNTSTRMCTTELKIRPMKKFMLSRGYARWDNVIGIRSDEPERVRKLSVSPPERWENVLPLADAGVTEHDVLSFWAKQPFDLGLRVDLQLGTYEGNCDLCMLKSDDKKRKLLAEVPERGAWWLAVEKASGSTFRNRAPLKLLEQSRLPELGDCLCHD